MTSHPRSPLHGWITPSPDAPLAPPVETGWDWIVRWALMPYQVKLNDPTPDQSAQETLVWELAGMDPRPFAEAELAAVVAALDAGQVVTLAATFPQALFICCEAIDTMCGGGRA